MNSQIVIIICVMSTFVFAQQPKCDDISVTACQLLLSQKPDLCSDPSLSSSACPRFCKQCPVECYHCNATVLDFHECNTTMLCGVGEICMRKELKSFVDGHHEYQMTCARRELCDDGSQIPNVFGKRSLESRDITMTCCGEDFCNYPQPTGTNGCFKDIVFLIDQSARSFHRQTQAIVSVLFHIAQQLDIGLNANMIGLYGYDTSVHTKFDLSQYPDKLDLLRAIQSNYFDGTYMTQRSDTDDAVNFLVHHAMQPQSGDRPSFADAVVIFADSRTSSSVAVSTANQIALKALSHDIIVVNIGSSSSGVEVVATNSAHIVHVADIVSADTDAVANIVTLLKEC